MRRILKSTMAWAMIVVMTAVICLCVSLAVLFVFGSAKGFFAVYFLGTVLTLLALGSFD